MTDTNTVPAVTRQPLKYFGSKWRIARWIIGHMPPHDVYVETHAGGASVLLQKPPAPIEVYNDLDSQVVNFFRVLREYPNEFIRLVELTPFSREEYVNGFEPTDDPIEAARRFYLVSWQSRGGSRAALSGNNPTATGWRFQRRNTSYKRAIDDFTSAPERLRQTVARLRDTWIEHDDAANVIDRYDTPETLFYVDPPYMHGTRSMRCSRGYAVELKDEEHSTLADRLREVVGMVIVSHYDCPEYDALYAGWVKHVITARTDGNNGGTVRRTEAIYINPRAAAMARQLSLFGGA